MGVIETQDDVFGGISFVEDFDCKIFKFALIFGGGNEAMGI